MTKENLLDAIRVGESSIHGQGLFAARVIHPPMVILTVRKETGDVTKPYLAAINHSCRPTCAFKGNRLVPLAPLLPNDEITVDFVETCDTVQPFECKCGARDCRGRIEVVYNMERTARRFKERGVFFLGSEGEEVNYGKEGQRVGEW